MAASSYVQRKINVVFTLGIGTWGQSGADTVTLSGLRVSAEITKAGGKSMGELQMRVYGMTQSQMNKLSTLGMMVQEVRRNNVAIMAGDDVNGMSLVYEGTIFDAWVDHEGDPETVFNVIGHAGLFEAIKPVPARSYSGTADAAVIMADIAGQMGLAFENNGVSVPLSNPYYAGTARVQAERCADAANINWIIDNGKLAIWPMGGSRGGVVPLISPATGMVGYPAYNSSGIVVKSLFNPSIVYGGAIEVQSSLTPACGKWVVQTLAYNLESETPNGAWFCQMRATPPGYQVVA